MPQISAVGAALFDQSNPFALAFFDEGSFKLGKRAHDGEQQGGHGGVVAGE